MSDIIVDEKLIKHVAKVARIDLSDEEIIKFTPQLKEIIGLFDELAKMDLPEDISFQPIEISDRMRDDDSIGECLTQEEALSLTEHKKDGYFKGPKTV